MNSTLTNREPEYKATEMYQEFNALFPHIDLSPFYGVQYGEVPPHDNNEEDDEEEVIEVDEVEGEEHDANGEDGHDAGVQVENNVIDEEAAHL